MLRGGIENHKREYHRLCNGGDGGLQLLFEGGDYLGNGQTGRGIGATLPQ